MNVFLQVLLNEEDFYVLMYCKNLNTNNFNSLKTFNEMVRLTYDRNFTLQCTPPRMYETFIHNKIYEGVWVKEQCKLVNYTKNILFTRKHIKNKKLINNNNNNYYYKNKHKKIGWMNNGKY